jgi:peptidoglycan/xylan/chitin deacetylase (PgdA/CDA1 family)
MQKRQIRSVNLGPTAAAIALPAASWTQGSILRAILLSALLTLAFVPLSTRLAEAASIRPGTYASTTAWLNLRSGPSTAHTILRVIPYGGQVFVNSGPYNSVWYDITHGGTRGYVHGSYLMQAATQRAAITIRKLNTSQKVVALTFDAGSDRGYAAQILDTLRTNRVKASFGITGQWAEANPDLVQGIASEGHTIINHTYTHRSFTGYSTGRLALSYNERADELWKTHAAILQIAGASSKPYFRPPYGDYGGSVLVDVRSRGYTYNIMWSVDSLGWNGLTKAQITQRVLNGLEPGAIYLFHVGSASQDGPALPDIIRELRARGYSFATVADYYR